MLPCAWPAAYAWCSRSRGLAGSGHRGVTSCSPAWDSAWPREPASTGRPGGFDLAGNWSRPGPLRLAAAAWVLYWSLRPDHAAVLGGRRLALVLGSACALLGHGHRVVAGVAPARVSAWVARAGHGRGAGLALLHVDHGLGMGRRPALAKPRAGRLAAEPDVGRVAGLVHDLPIRAGAAPIFPYTGLAAPPPHPELEMATRRQEAFSAAGLARLKRYGVTHGIWDGPVDPARVAPCWNATILFWIAWCTSLPEPRPEPAGGWSDTRSRFPRRGRRFAFALPARAGPALGRQLRS